MDNLETHAPPISALTNPSTLTLNFLKHNSIY